MPCPPFTAMVWVSAKISSKEVLNTLLSDSNFCLTNASYESHAENTGDLLVVIHLASNESVIKKMPI